MILANEYVTVFESPDPAKLCTYSPAICRCADGRLIATLDLCGQATGALGEAEAQTFQQGKVFTSDDGGATWQHRADYPFIEARLFVACDSVYALGNYGGEGRGDMAIIRSDDRGQT